MLNYSFSALISTLAVAVLLLSCAPTAEPTPSPKPPATSLKAEIPAAPPATEAAPTPTLKPAVEQPRYGGELTISTLGDPVTLDMQQEVSYLVANVIQCAYNGVTQLDPNNPEEVIGDLARSWEVSKDGLTYTFHLDENVKFHDGTPFTSEDVRFSFERMVTPPKGIRAPRSADPAGIDRIETTDKKTVKFILKYASAAFLDVISSGWMVVYSKAFVENKGDMKRDIMGTGPYKLRSYSAGTSLMYVKNPDYFVKGRPYLDAIAFYIIRDAATRLSAFRTGRVKLTGPGMSGLTPSSAEIIRRTLPQAIIVPYPSLTNPHFLMNTQEKPWSDIRVRKSVHLAIDRQKAIDVMGQGYGELGSSMPGKWGIPKEELMTMPGWRQPKDADIADAKRLLAEAGYPNGFTVKTLVRAEKWFEEWSVFIADQLAKIGVKLELDVKETAIRTALLYQGDFNSHPTYTGFTYADPQNLARIWVAPVGGDWGMNWQRLEDKKILELFEKQSGALDPAERKKIVRELDLRMIELAARVSAYWEEGSIGMWPEVKNRGKPMGDYSFQKYQDVWLAK